MCKFGATLCAILFVNLTFLSSTFAESDNDCKALETTASKRLRKYLFCEYKWWLIGTPDAKKATRVFVGLEPLLSSFNEEDGTLEITSDTFIYWRDPFFKWEYKAYNNITSLYVKSHRIWQPDIAVLSAGTEDSNYYGIPWHSRCGIWHDGVILCSPVLTHRIRCQTDFTQWPFDRQNCTLVFSTWLRASESIQFIEDAESAVDMSMYFSNEEWTLTVSRIFYDERNSSFSNRKKATLPRLSIDFILDRVHNQLSGRHVSPAIIMMVMTLITLWLDPRSIERLVVACINPIIHLYCIQELHWNLPHNGTTVPNLLLFYANSLVLATIALILTFVLGSLQEIKIEPPKWILSSTATILRSKVGQILLLSMLDPKVAASVEPDADDAGDLMSANSKSTTWGYVAIMCGWISFISLFFTYILMYAVLVPNSSMRPPLKALGV